MTPITVSRNSATNAAERAVGFQQAQKQARLQELQNTPMPRSGPPRKREPDSWLTIHYCNLAHSETQCTITAAWCGEEMDGVSVERYNKKGKKSAKKTEIYPYLSLAIQALAADENLSQLEFIDAARQNAWMSPEDIEQLLRHLVRENEWEPSERSEPDYQIHIVLGTLGSTILGGNVNGDVYQALWMAVPPFLRDTEAPAEEGGIFHELIYPDLPAALATLGGFFGLTAYDFLDQAFSEDWISEEDYETIASVLATASPSGFSVPNCLSKIFNAQK